MAASSTTSTDRAASPPWGPGRSASINRRSTVTDAIPAPACNSRAARAAHAVPTTGIPAASQAARAASRAKVLPAPARPTTTSTPAPDRVTAATITRCSPDNDGRAANAASNAATGTTPTPAPTRAWACSIRFVSNATSSVVLNRGPWGVEASRATTASSASTRSAPPRSAAVGAPQGWAAAKPCRTWRRSKLELRPVNPPGPTSSPKTTEGSGVRGVPRPSRVSMSGRSIDAACSAHRCRSSPRAVAGSLAGRVSNVATAAARALV
jgi:hypothetical protein